MVKIVPIFTFWEIDEKVSVAFHDIFCYDRNTTPDIKNFFCVEGAGQILQHLVLCFAAPIWGADFLFGGTCMETRIAVVSIIVEEPESVETLNAILHEYGSYIIGRMGIPYRAKERKVNIISIAMDAPQDVTSTMAGKIGKLAGTSVKTAYSNVINHHAETD